MFQAILLVCGLFVGTYGCMLAMLRIRTFQAVAIYLHPLHLSCLKDLRTPCKFGFPPGQVTPFWIHTSKGSQLFAWHIAPFSPHPRPQHDLPVISSYATDNGTRIIDILQELRDDVHARLIIHLHGAAGTVGSGCRPESYRLLANLWKDSRLALHVITFDYRGFGLSKGFPSEVGLVEDALDVISWVHEVAAIEPSRIVLYGHSLGTAVQMAVAERLAPQTNFAGHLLVAGFVDVQTLARTYKVAGILPILGPATLIPAAFQYLVGLVHDQWRTGGRIASFVKQSESAGVTWQIVLLHARNDPITPFVHSQRLYECAAPSQAANGEMALEYRGDSGKIGMQILCRGRHDDILTLPVLKDVVESMFDQ